MENICLIAMSVLQMIGSVFMFFVYSFRALVLCFVPRSFKRKDVKDKIVLITGGGSGLGRLVAMGLAKKGARIVSWDVNTAGNEETVRLIQKENGRCSSYTVDLCNRKQIYLTAEMVKKEVGKVDILVNNAGIVTGKNFMDAPDELVLRTFDVNVLSHFWTVKAFLPDMMKANSGQVVTIASLAGFFGINKLVDYCSSKFAAVGFDESLRMELEVDGYTGISTTVVCPYFINTGMFDGVQSRLLPILEQDYVAAEITDAILMRSKMLILPTFCSLLVALKGLMPYRTSIQVYKAMSGSSSMSHLKENHIKENGPTSIDVVS